MTTDIITIEPFPVRETCDFLFRASHDPALCLQEFSDSPDQDLTVPAREHRRLGCVSRVCRID